MILIRIGAGLLLATLVFNGLWWLALPLCLWYVLTFNAYEVIVGAFCIDVYFAPTLFQFYYTVWALMLVFGGMQIRPMLRR
ncbi:MAG: hypothetical protein RLZZ70_817 [Candidatus Parcubacteria bacterium]|jgi:hypothetical protein